MNSTIKTLFLYGMTMLFATACLRPNPLNDSAVESDPESASDSAAADAGSDDTPDSEQEGTDDGSEENKDVCAGGCLIDGACYRENEPAPDNSCRACIPEKESGKWTSLDATPCDDGDFCNGADSCSEGTCTLHAGSPCEAQTEVCELESAECCELDQRRECGEDGDVWAIDSCGIARTVAENCHDDNARCEAGTCRCLPGWSGANCDQCTFYVDSTASAAAQTDGLSWETAFSSLQEGIDAAEADSCQVWVARGTYTPAVKNAGSTVRHRTFLLHPGVALYGGFAGT